MRYAAVTHQARCFCDTLGTLTMAFERRHPALLRPSAVAVEDDADACRKFAFSHGGSLEDNLEAVKGLRRLAPFDGYIIDAREQRTFVEFGDERLETFLAPLRNDVDCPVWKIAHRAGKPQTARFALYEISKHDHLHATGNNAVNFGCHTISKQIVMRTGSDEQYFHCTHIVNQEPIVFDMALPQSFVLS